MLKSKWFFFSSRRRHTRSKRDWSSDVCSSDLDPSQDDRDDEEVDFRSGRVIYLTCGHIVGWVPPLPEEEVALELTVVRRRSEERRVGKECRARWSAYH